MVLSEETYHDDKVWSSEAMIFTATGAENHINRTRFWSIYCYKLLTAHKASDLQVLERPDNILFGQPAQLLQLLAFLT